MGMSIDLSKKYESVAKLDTSSSKIASELSNLTSTKDKTSKTDKKENFKDVLKTQNEYNKSDTSKVADTSKDTEVLEKVEDLENKIDELEEKIENLSESEGVELLNIILNLLNEVNNSNNIVDVKGTINSDILNSIIENINSVKENGTINLSDLISNLTELLNNEASKDILDNNSLKLIEKLLTKLNTSLDENINANKEIKNSINNLIDDISEKIDNQESKKTLSLEEMLNRNNSNSNKEGSSKNESNSKETLFSSKEDKFLNKLLNKDDSLDKINLFSIRNQLQTQSVNTTQAASNTTINSVSFTNDLIQDVKYMVSNALKELTVKINPGNLGQMTISLIEENGVMKANLKATSKETVELLAQNLVEIKKQLADQNLKIADVNIELYQDDTTFFKQKDFESEMHGHQDSQNKTSGSNGIDFIKEEELIEEEIAVDNSSVNFLA